MNNKEQFKRILSFFTSLILMSVFVIAFGYVWYVFYRGITVDGIEILDYYRRGHWVVIGIYAIIIMLFMNIYGSYKVWYLKTEDAIYSQIISIICANVVEYFQISLIGKDFMPVSPMVMLTVFDLVFAFAWTFGISALFRKLYPPRKMIMIYDGSKNAQTLVEKMSLRSDKYMICKAICVSNGLDKILYEIQNYDSLIICDIDNEL